jgi:DNA-directed RNA polymerase specialized sigma24 family protein
LRRYRAERLLRKSFPALRSKVIAIVRSRLRAKGISLDQGDLESCYAQAWQGLYTTVLAGETVDSPEAWLVLVTFRRAIDEARSASRADLGAEEDVAAFAADSVAGAARETDIAAGIDDRARLRAVFEALRGRLSERECQAASLCYLQGLSRAEAAARMGISERRMSKLMEGTGGGEPGVAGKVGELLAVIQAGGWCERQSSLMRAYAFGILDPDGERHALAVAHTRECPACRAHVAALRGLASVLPPLPFVFSFAPAGGRAAGARAWRASAGRGARAGMRPPRAGLRLLRARMRPLRAGGGWLGGGGSLSAKLAVSGVVLLGAGAAYLAVRSPAPPARGQAVHAAAAAAAGHSSVTSFSPAPAVSGPTRAAARHAARAASARQRSNGRGAKARHAASRGERSAGEFSPERVRGETLPPAPVARAPAPASAPPASSGAAGEFGVE